jgi:hypothetical protein
MLGEDLGVVMRQFADHDVLDHTRTARLAEVDASSFPVFSQPLGDFARPSACDGGPKKSYVSSPFRGHR